MAVWVSRRNEERKFAAMKTVEPGNLVSHPVAGSPATAIPHTSRKRFSRRWKWLAVPIVLLALFYAVVGYFGSGLMIGYNPRWHGMNRGPQDFGLRSETVSFQAID
jgi:hypothetical protein